MAEVIFPRRNLPGDSDSWGREIENYIRKTRNDLDALGQSSQGQNRSTASSLSVLGGQFTDLVGRKSYFGGGTDTTQTWYNGTTVSNLGFGPTVNFTLSDTRLVKLRSTLYVEARADCPASSSATPVVLIRWAATNPQTTGSFDDVFFEVPVSPYGRFLSEKRRLVGETFQVLPAGDYTFQGSVTVNMYNYSSGTWASEATISDPTYSVDVLQPA